MIDAQFYFSAIYVISQLQEQCHVEVTKVVIVRARAITLRTATPLPLCEYYHSLQMF